MVFVSEPRLEDFHRPYDGEETSSVSDLFSIQNLISSTSEQSDNSAQRSRTNNDIVQRSLMPEFFKDD
jgi:hypothetical protein